MSVDQDVFQWNERSVERRSTQRSFCGKSALLFFNGSSAVHSCFVRNISTVGSSIRLDNVRFLPLVFLLSFDKFQSVHTCRLRWRDRDFIGVSIEQ
jgi:hypothetical protein